MIIGFINLKGGVGKSTLCINVAGALASRGKKVLIIDLDPQQTAKNWYRMRDNSDRRNLLSIHVVSLSVKNYAFPMRRQIINALENRAYEIGLLDGAANDERVSTAALNLSDLVIIPMRPSGPDFDGTKRTVNFINKPPPTVDRIPDWIVVQNNVNAQTNIARKYATEILPQTWEDNILQCQVGDRVAFQESIERGLTVIEHEPGGRAAQEIMTITEAIIKRANR